MKTGFQSGGILFYYQRAAASVIHENLICTTSLLLLLEHVHNINSSSEKHKRTDMINWDSTSFKANHASE